MTAQEIAGYVEQLTTELAGLARSHNLERLAQICEQAAIEAAETLKSGSSSIAA